MKNIFYLLFAVIFLVNCKNEEQDTDTLPEATQSGKNTGEALVNGEIWVAKIINNGAGGGAMATSYSASDGEYRLKILLLNVKSPNNNLIWIDVKSNMDFTPGDYVLDNDVTNRGLHLNAEDPYYTTAQQTGVLTITHFDKANRIVSGTFSFKCQSSSGKTVTITDGRFDKKYLQ